MCTCFELRGEGEQFGVGRQQALVQFAQHEHLWTPILGVGRTLLKPQQSIPRSLQVQPPDTIPPLLLRTAEEGESVSLHNK